MSTLSAVLPKFVPVNYRPEQKDLLTNVEDIKNLIDDLVNLISVFSSNEGNFEDIKSKMSLLNSSLITFPDNQKSELETYTSNINELQQLYHTVVLQRSNPS